MQADPRRVVVIDDDPTGTQAVSGVRVLLAPDRAGLDAFFAGPERALYVLSNSRALSAADAAALVGRIAPDARAAAAAAGERVAVLLRGDSTLRGHVFAETDAVEPGAPVLFVPAFLDGGRITAGGVHYLVRDGVRTPVAGTEFARDPRFGYRSSRLADWVAETGGRRGIPVPGPVTAEAVAAALRAAGPGDVVLPDATTAADIDAIVAGLVAAEAGGVTVAVRCAASLAAARAGLACRPLDRIEVPPGRVLVVCGSFTAASTAQVTALGALWDRRVEVPAGARPNPTLVRTLADQVAGRLGGGRALLCTARDWAASADDGVALMDTLVATVAAVAGQVDGVIAKGGITSARVARDGLGAAWAEVIGQPAPGVALWRLCGERPYVVVPGNVGDDRTLADLLAMVR
jgi:uncharacterized protein YgbK (DUF1537 family)